MERLRDIEREWYGGRREGADMEERRKGSEGYVEGDPQVGGRRILVSHSGLPVLTLIASLFWERMKGEGRRKGGRGKSLKIKKKEEKEKVMRGRRDNVEKSMKKV